MDDQTQQQNTQDQSLADDQSQKKQSDDQQVQGNVGATPEAGPMQTRTETQPAQTESGYERIKQIEKSAEAGEQKETAPKPQGARRPAPKPKPKPDPKTPEKKEPPVKRPKYFGYQPPPRLANDTEHIKRNAGKGNVKDSQTWLLTFLDRLLKKETE
ncbi:hypothetical protein GF389_03440 [Candidatus Dojkabacteria bacterium]|nr:hypothetical protein [Candidatus Dojkabacteria bacterium]